MPSISVPALTIGASVIGAGASLASGAMNSSAASSAANAQVNQDKSALALQQQEFNTTQANLSPWMQAGQSALGQYGNLIGSNGSTQQQAAIAALQQSPLYTSMINQGDQAVLAQASATGGLRGGNIQNSLANFNANALNTVIQNQIGNLGTLSGSGQNAAAGLGGFAANYAGTASSTLGNIGSAQAGGILGSTGLLTGGINTGLSSLLNGLGYSQGYGGVGGGYPTNTTTTVGSPPSSLDGLF
jgi:hypothetical protein